MTLKPKVMCMTLHNGAASRDSLIPLRGSGPGRSSISSDGLSNSLWSAKATPDVMKEELRVENVAEKNVIEDSKRVVY